MKLAERFPLNASVRLTPRGCAVLRASRRLTPWYGVVRGYSQDGLMLRVQPAGRKSVNNYFPEHWETVSKT